MRPILLLSVICLLLLPIPAAGAEFYRWVDKDGNEHFTNDPGKVPAENYGGSSAVEAPQGWVNVGEKRDGRRTVAPAIKQHKDKYGHGEEWWRRRARKLRRELRELQDEYELVLRKEREQEEQGTFGRKKKSGKKYGAKKMQLEKKIARARRNLDADLPEEARRAGAYPGWLRE